MISRMRKNSTHMLDRVFHSIDTTLNNPGGEGLNWQVF